MSRRLVLAGNRTYLKKIYENAVSKNVNPVMPLVIWGVEASWQLNGTEFGVISPRVRHKGFNLQLDSSTNILRREMTSFTAHQKNGGRGIASTYKPKCYYTDMFSYAYEWYTPVCHESDGNDPSRKNFIDFYKIFMGIK